MSQKLEGWLALEWECGAWQARQETLGRMRALWDRPSETVSRYSYGARVYGGNLEPGYRLTSERRTTECPECGRWRLFRQDWEAVEGGSLNYYYSEECAACGHFETNGDW